MSSPSTKYTQAHSLAIAWIAVVVTLLLILRVTYGT